MLKEFKALVLVFALFPSLPASAAVFNVANTADSGSSSLRDAVSSATAAGGANSVSWIAGSGGQVTLLTNLPVADLTTLDVSAAPSSVTIAAASLTLNGGVTFNNTSVVQPWAISSSIVGVGSMTKSGAGVLILTGGNSYAGGTFLNAGTLNINSASSLGSGALTFNGGKLQTASTITFANAITLAAGGGTIDTLGNASVFSGVISGAGGLTNASTGTLALTGANTYLGGTFLSSGTLNVARDTALGAAAGGLTFNGGTLQLAADMASARAITLTGAGAFDTNSKNLTLTGVISGAGGFTKLGAGILTLTGANTYAGATAVDAGTLALGANNALPAATALRLSAAGTLDLATFQTTVNTFNSAGGTVKTTLLGAGPSQLVVTGARTINGGTLVVSIAPGQLVAANQAFTVITSVGNGAAPDFAKIVSPAALLFTPTYAANSVVLTASFVPFATSAATGNQGAIGGSLEALRAAPAGDAAAVLSTFYSLDAGQLRAALDQLSPVALATMQGVGLAGSGLQSAAVSQRMAVLADGAEHPGFAAYNVSGRSSYPGVLVAETLGDDNLAPPASGGAREGAPWGYFASASVATGRLTESNSAAGSQPGYKFSSGGLTVGADYRFDEHFTAGGSVGYLKGHATISAPGSGVVDDDSARFGGYAAANAGQFHASGYLGGAVDSFSTRRDIQIPGIARSASASPLGTELNASSKVSYDLPTAEWGTYSPFAGATYDRMMIGAFTEAGAGALNLSVAPQTAQSLQSTLGLRVSQQWTTDARVYTPYFSLGWRHEFQDQSRPISARFATGVGAPFSVATGSYARDGTVVGFGLSATVTKNASARLDYTGDFRSHFVSTLVNLEGRLRF